MKLPANLLLMLAGTLVLTSCSMLVGKSEDLTVYAPTLAAPTLAGPAQSPPHKARAWQLSVAEPHAISPLDGAHIAVMPVAGEVQTYKGVRWRDSAPVLVQQLLFQAFQDTAALPGLGAPASVLHADFALQSNLRDFQAEYRGAKVPTVVIRLSTQLVENSTGRVLAARTFAVEQPCAGGDVPEVFAAFQAALNQVLPQVVEWTVAAGDANWIKPSRSSP